MQEIIEKAIEGGYSIQESYYMRHLNFIGLIHTNEFNTVFETDETVDIEDNFGNMKKVPMTTSHQTKSLFFDHLFWQCLGKACGWTENEIVSIPKYNMLCFMEINYTQGFDKAVEWLSVKE